jgi:drug/metabolite transporter (DMT)-like permease
MTVESSAALAPNAKLVAIICGIGAAACWAVGLVCARRGIAIGLSPADLAFHRFMWSGLIMLPLALRFGLRDLGGIGWGTGIALMVLGGPGLSILSHAGFLLAPLGHGAVVQPSTATLGGLVLATLILREHPSRARVAGALVIVAGLVLMGIDALLNIGTHALGGDTLFICAGMCWASMLTILRLRGIDSVRATVIISVLSLLIYAPLHAVLFGFDNMVAVGWRENALQIVAQGILSGPLATYLSAYAASVLGTGRGATFSALVPGFTVLIGVLALGEIPTLIQLGGLAVVAVGFRYVMKR